MNYNKYKYCKVYLYSVLGLAFGCPSYDIPFMVGYLYNIWSLILALLKSERH